MKKITKESLEKWALSDTGVKDRIIPIRIQADLLSELERMDMPIGVLVRFLLRSWMEMNK